MPYQLPTDPSIASTDPLGIHNVEHPQQCEVLDRLLEGAIVRIASNAPLVDALPGVIEDIAYTIHGNGTLDISHLRDYLLLHQSSLSPETITFLLSMARVLPEHFPAHSLKTLHTNGDTVSCNGAQVNVLLAHQFLGTLPQVDGTSWGIPCFTTWFAANPAHQQAVDGYLATVFHFFAQGGYPETANFDFSMFTADDMPDPSECDRLPHVQLFRTVEEFEPSNAPGTPFVLVAANSQPGPGPTATQEERLQSASPALSTSALFTPIIADGAAVVTSAFPVHAAWKGHNRTARLARLFAVEERPSRQYILADALQLDVEEEAGGIRDLQASNVEREVKKLYAAFSGAAKMRAAEGGTDQCIVEAGAWGCGAFGGNILVKTICMMIASAMADVVVHLTLLEQRGAHIEAIMALLGKNLTAKDLWKCISDPSMQTAKATNDIMQPFGISLPLLRTP